MTAGVFASLSAPALLGLLVLALTIEAGMLVGLVIPGTAVVLTAGAVADVVGVPPVLVASAAAIGTLAGGQLGFRLGRRRHGAPTLVVASAVTARLWSSVAAAIAARPNVTVAAGQWLSYGRVAIPRSVGWTGVSAVSFTVSHTASGLAWAATLTMVGHATGELARQNLSILVGLASGLLITATLLWSWARSHRADSPRKPDPGSCDGPDAPARSPGQAPHAPGSDTDQHRVLDDGRQPHHLESPPLPPHDTFPGDESAFTSTPPSPAARHHHRTCSLRCGLSDLGLLAP